jgi:shikimate kinase
LVIITLVGYRGTGKSTVARLLAHRLGWMCIDTDEEVQQLTGKAICDIFRSEGEAAFRGYESQVIHQLTRRHKVVLAAGGGAVLDPDNRRALSMAGSIVWLTALPETIRRRLRDDAGTAENRPALTGNSVTDEIETVLAERLPIYRACADLSVPTDGREPRELVELIVAALDLAPETGLL